MPTPLETVSRATQNAHTLVVTGSPCEDKVITTSLDQLTTSSCFKGHNPGFLGQELFCETEAGMGVGSGTCVVGGGGGGGGYPRVGGCMDLNYGGRSSNNSSSNVSINPGTQLEAMRGEFWWQPVFSCLSFHTTLESRGKMASFYDL